MLFEVLTHRINIRFMLCRYESKLVPSSQAHMWQVITRPVRFKKQDNFINGKLALLLIICIAIDFLHNLYYRYLKLKSVIFKEALPPQSISPTYKKLKLLKLLHYYLLMISHYSIPQYFYAEVYLLYLLQRYKFRRKIL